MAVHQSITLTESWQKVIITIVLLWFLWLVRDVVALLILALTVAAASFPLVNALVRWRWPRVLSAVTIYFSLLLIIAGILFFLIPSVVNQVHGIAIEIPNVYGRFVGAFEVFERLLERSNLNYSPAEFLGQFTVSLSQWASRVLSSTFDLARGIASLAIVIVISFYLVVREGGIEGFLTAVTPSRHESYVLDLWRRVNKKIGRWLQSQLLLGLIIGILTYIGLRIFDMPFALALALIAGVFELIPFVGPILSAVPAVILGFLHSPSLGILMLLLYFIIQQLENHLITPAITGKLVGLDPVLVIVALIAGGSVGGIVGVFIAIPITVTVVEIFEDFAARKRGAPAGSS